MLNSRHRSPNFDHYTTEGKEPRISIQWSAKGVSILLEIYLTDYVWTEKLFAAAWADLKDRDFHTHKQQTVRLAWLKKARDETQCSLQGLQMALGLWRKRVSKGKGGSTNTSLANYRESREEVHKRQIQDHYVSPWVSVTSWFSWEN